MKRYLTYIMFALATLLTGCQRSTLDEPYFHGSKKDIPDDCVNLEFSVRYAGGQTAQTWTKAMEETKALGDKPEIQNLRLAVFNEAGYLEAYVTATEADGHVTDNGRTNSKKYTAQLPVIDDPVIIHFIANGPATLDFGHETSVIGGLYTQKDENGDYQDAYWQRVERPMGLKKKDPETPELADTTGLSMVPLIRNFARVTITASAGSGIEILGAHLMQNADRGSIAPYNRTEGRFITNYREYKTTEALIEATGYDGFVPTSRILNTTVPAVEDFTPVVDVNGKPTAYDYLYERETPSGNPVYVMVKALYGNDTEPCYYKVELRSPTDEYFPVLRNFDYKINILQVLRRGAPTPQDAANMSGSGDVSTSQENEELINIADGTSRIFVSYTDTTVVNNKEILLKYKYIPDINNAATTVKNSVTDTTSKDHTEVFLGDADPDLGPAIASYTIDERDDQTDNYRIIHITPSDPSDEGTNKQSIIIKGRKWNSETGKYHNIQRKVNIYVREILHLIVECDPKEVNQASGTEVDVLIKVPAGLPQMMFPLQMTIESSKLSITPDSDNLPVSSGKSIIPNSSAIAFQFTKEITWDDYTAAEAFNIGNDSYKSFRCNFKTNVAASASTVYVANQYFVTGSDSFTNYTADTFSDLTFSHAAPMHLNEDTNFSFGMRNYDSSNPLTVTVTLDGFEPADGEEGLTYVGDTEDGLPQYTYQQRGTSGNNFNLTCTDYQGNGVVSLEAYHYAKASGTMRLEGDIFTPLAFSKFVGKGIGATTTFTFNLPTKPTSAVNIILDSLEPDPNHPDSRLVSKGNGKYEFTPSGNGTGTQTLYLRSTVAKGTVSARLSTYGYMDAYQSSKIGTKTLKMNAQTIRFTSSGNSSPFVNSNHNVNVPVYIRTESHPEDLESAPKTAVNRYQQYNEYRFRNNDAVTAIEVDEDAKYLYFLIEYNNTTYLGTMDISGYNDGDTISGSVAFATRKNPNKLRFNNQVLGMNSQKTLQSPDDYSNSGGALTYTSSDESIAKVQNGVLYSYASGVAIITVNAASNNQYEAATTTFKVTVLPDPVKIVVSDETVGNVKSSLVIKNDGGSSAFIRASIVGNWVDASGNIVAPWSESDGTFAGLPGSGWTKSGDFYYYTTAVEAGSSPSAALFTTYTKPSTPPVPGAKLEMTISVQGVEATAGLTYQTAFVQN